MASSYEQTRRDLRAAPRTWSVTGVAGFIGSHVLETLLMLDQRVTGLDNFATGSIGNLEDVQARVGAERWARFTMIEGDIRSPESCRRACEGMDLVLHQAALGSVLRSIADPLASHESNVTGTLNMLLAAREQGVGRFVYASSSSVYGDDPELPRREERTGRPLSPYAATKVASELYAAVFAHTYRIEVIGLRYFNVFGPRQDPSGTYAAVIPRWIAGLLNGDSLVVYGDGETSRDFCYVANVVQANLLAATTTRRDATGRIYNVAVQDRTTLNELFHEIRERVVVGWPAAADRNPVYEEFRPGDVRHSIADITAARSILGYRPTHTLEEGLDETVAWFRSHLTAGKEVR